MSDTIYILQDDGDLTEVREAAYNSEALLQGLLAKYPNLLAGEQMNSAEPRRWILVTREMLVPDGNDAGGRWSLDHLFLDQDGIPTLVEVKRSTDTRIRREVIGQMLDYAANAVVHWPIDRIRQAFERTCEQTGLDANEAVDGLVDGGMDVDEFWRRVETNLAALRIRLVFVADVLPAELRRVIEFLNEAMDRVEVLGVEIRQFVGEGLKTLVPRVVGRTEMAQARKSSGTSQRESVSEEEFWELFGTEQPQPEQQTARAIVAWAHEHGLKDGFKTGANGAAFIPTLQRGAKSFKPFAVLARGGNVTLRMAKLVRHAPFNDPAVRGDLQKRLSRLPGLAMGAKGIEGFPTISLATLREPAALQECLGVLTWMIEALE